MNSLLGIADARQATVPAGDGHPDHITIESIEACRRLAAQFPDVDAGEIELLMGKALEHTLHAPIETFRVLLAERSTRARLRALAAHEAR